VYIMGPLSCIGTSAAVGSHDIVISCCEGDERDDEDDALGRVWTCGCRKSVGGVVVVVVVPGEEVEEELETLNREEWKTLLRRLRAEVEEPLKLRP